MLMRLSRRFGLSWQGGDRLKVVIRSQADARNVAATSLVQMLLWAVLKPYEQTASMDFDENNQPGRGEKPTAAANPSGSAAYRIGRNIPDFGQTD
jgi:hypothetical protein